MLKIKLVVAFVGLSTAAVLAQTNFSDLDADLDGELSLQEVQGYWPNMTSSGFRNADLDGSGALNSDEISIMQGMNTAVRARPRSVTPRDTGVDPSSTGQTSSAEK